MTHVKIAPLQLNALYEFGFSALRFGKMGIAVEQTPSRYSMTSDIVSTGLVNLFVRHSSHTTAEATGENYTYSHIDYASHYQTKKKKKSAQLVYQNNTVIEEGVAPPDNRAVRPAVPAELKNDSSDPLSLILRMRQGLFDAQKNQQADYSIKVYDGRRLMLAHFSLIGKKSVTFKGREVPVIEVTASRKLLAGYTESEIAEQDPNEPLLHIYFTDDERLLPIKLEASLWIGTLYAVLAKECTAGESCLLGNKE